MRIEDTAKRSLYASVRADTNSAVSPTTFMKTLLHASPDPIFVLDRLGTVLLIGEAGARALGLPASQIAGKSLRDIGIVPEVTAELLAQTERVVQTQQPVTGTALLPAYNGLRYYDYQLSPLPDDRGEVTSVLCMAHDVTDRQVLKSEIRTQEVEIVALNRDLQQRLQEIEAIFRTVPAAIHIAEDAACTCIRGNPAAYRMLRLSEGVNFSKTGASDAITPFRIYRDGQEVPGEDLPLQVAARTGQEVRDAEVELVWDDGVTHHWVGSAAPLFDEQGNIRGSVGAFVDITERMHSEKALMDSEARLILGMQVAGLALAEVDYGTGLNHLTAEAARLFGLGESAVALPRAKVHATFYPEDRPELMRRIAESLDPKGAGWFVMDHRVVWPGGEVRWLRVRKQVFFAGEGEARRPIRAMLAAFDVTAEKQAMEAVRATEAFVSRVLNSLPECVVVLDEQGVVCAVNERWRRFALENGGFPDAVSVGVDYLAVCRRSIATGDPQAQEVLVGLEALLTGRRSEFVVEYPCHAPGREQWFLMHAQRALYGAANVIISHVDITERKRAEEALRQAHHQLETVLSSISDGLLVVDKNWRYTYFSEPGARMLGMRPEQLLGGIVWELFPQAKDTKFYENYRLAMESGQPVQFEEFYPDPLNLWLECHCYPFEEGMSVYFHDITARKKAQQEIAALNARLQRSITESHHRIKNNLQILSALVDMQIVEGTETIPASEFKRVGQHARTLAAFHDLLTSESKISSDQDFISLKAALEKITPMLQSAVSDRKFILRADEITVPLNQASSFALLVNELASNALKHGKGEIEITLIRVPDAEAEGNAGRPLARLEVCDDGPGFPIGFDSKQAANTGLELIESVGQWDLRGEITYENRAEGGARVVITFPLPEQLPTFAA